MESFMSQETLNLTITHRYEASAERIFRAWTDPEALKAWFRPSAQMQTPRAETDLRTGGDYQIELQTVNGKRYQVSGLYHEIAEPVKLAFTWRWGDETDAEDTYVALTLRQLSPTETELTLFHDEFFSVAERDRQREIWIGVLSELEVYLG
jgi:uncharacterized protein YndB with AHSA1/START domain